MRSIRYNETKRKNIMKVFFKALTFTLVIIIAVSCMVFTVSADVGLDGINYAIDSENFTATATKFYGSQKDVVIPEKALSRLTLPGNSTFFREAPRNAYHPIERMVVGNCTVSK